MRGSDRAVDAEADRTVGSLEQGLQGTLSTSSRYHEDVQEMIGQAYMSAQAIPLD